MATEDEKIAATAHFEPIAQPKPATIPPNSTSQSLVDQVSLFVAHADRTTLISTAAGAVAVSYVLFGRLALLLIGAIGGVVLHIWWEGQNSGADGDNEGAAKRKRHELSLEVANRLTALYADNASKVDDDEAASSGESALDYSRMGPATEVALTALTNSVIADYVSWWYKPILPSEDQFPEACRNTLVSMVLAVSSRVSRKRPADMFLQFATNSTSFMIVFFSELSAAVGTATTGSRPVADSIDEYLDKNPESSLANVLSSDQQENKLGLVGTDILKTFLEPSVYNCGPLRIFLREVLSRLILQPTIDMCSDAEYINTWIVYLLEQGEPQLLNAIDAGLEQADNIKHKRPISTGTPTTNELEREVSNIAPNLGDQKPVEQVQSAKQLSDINFAHNENLSTVANLGDTPRPQNTEQTSRDSAVYTHIPTDSSSSNTTDPKPTPGSSGSVNENPLNSPPLGSQTTPILDSASPSPVTAQPSQFRGSSVSIIEDFNEDDKSNIRSKPTSEYLIQIEPSNTKLTGWMIARKYSDFEILHETLRRISVVSGISDFSLHHNELPGWKGRNRSSLRVSLEKYLQAALQYEQLAECEGIKKFLEKGRQSGLEPDSALPKSGFPFAAPAAVFENVGKGVMGVLGTAPKGVANSGKALVGGVSGIFGASGNDSRKRVNSNAADRPTAIRGTSMDIQPSAMKSFTAHSKNLSMSNLQERPRTVFQPQPAHQETESGDISAELPTSTARASSSLASSCENLAEEGNITPQSSPDTLDAPHVALPPAGNIETNAEPVDKDKAESTSSNGIESPPKRSSEGRNYAPVSEEEAVVVVELLFAVINEVYSLSSAWNIRKRLLNASKSFLLRPGNPSLEAIRALLQDSIIDGNTTDEALAGYITKLHKSSLPTEEDIKAYPPPLSLEQKEQLRIKARALLISRGMPPALMGIMGANATGEALGKIFDCLQIPSVGRAFVFAILLQAIRVMTQ
ncbi:PX domain-containing protein [Nannizzia gypsea CBS 118893]|uniref:PX domain-containing protein n=1 Tax=Arthroderma gypseum (strain ATCC MYA-4604 / CBS 118893) TaxID=535722 RepID=E5QYN3_ARTGP|nr:PX domain-containing protein [Nannizzia gypsea CBS 118893]EFQ98896.1 PX domain-containing protein [Nannizzia gypsea CBS 118893]